MPAQLRKLEGPNSGPSPVVLGPLFEICAPPILRLTPWLLHTSNTVFLICGPPF